MVLLVLVIKWIAVRFGINITSVALKMDKISMQQEWCLSQISLLFLCYSQLIYHTGAYLSFVDW